MRPVAIAFSCMLVLSLFQEIIIRAEGRAVQSKDAYHKTKIKQSSQKYKQEKGSVGKRSYALKKDSEGKNSIVIDNLEFQVFIATILKDAITCGQKDKYTEDLLIFCERILNAETEFDSEEIQRILPELISLALTKIEQTKAPRPDAPGNTDGAPVGTLLECDFSQVLQILNRLTQIINQCCATLQLDFQFTWTILADIKSTITNDFNGTFTFLNEINNTLTTCCANIQNDFIGVFTSLTDVKSTITNDFNGTFTVLDEINNTLTTCCANIQVDFNGVFTAIADVKSSLTTCCADIQNDFIGVFTSLTEINDTLTTCCSDIQIDFNGVFTFLSDIQTTITSDFAGTFTVLESLKSVGSPCSAVPITTATIITEPGFYCLANDIVGTLTISATDVTVDLNNHTISAPAAMGIFINNAVNAIITNGKIDTTTTGVEFGQTNTIVTLSNVLITNCSANAIQFDASATVPSGIILQDIIIDSCATGINGSVSNSQFNNIIIRRSTGIAIDATINESIFTNIEVVDCGNNPGGNSAYLLSGSNNQLINCSAIQFVGERGFNLSMNDSILKNCIIQDLGPSALIGIVTVGSNMVFQDCSVINMSGSEFVSAVGISNSGANVLFQNCLVESVRGIRLASSNSGFQANNVTTRFIGCKAYDMLGFGFFNSGAGTAIYMENCETANNSLDGFVIVENTLMKGCTSFSNGRNGYNVSGPGVSLLDCVATNNNSDGFILTTNNIVVVGNCTAYANGGNGFNNSTALTLPMYGCFSTQNGTNYTACPNTQNANTQVDTSVVGLTGPFARGNDFI